MEFPFTIAELQEAFELVMPADQAAQFASSWESPEQTYQAGFIGYGVTVDVLILLSFVSDDLRERVDEYRKRFGPGLQGPEWRSRSMAIESVLRQAGKLPRS